MSRETSKAYHRLIQEDADGEIDPLWSYVVQHTKVERWLDIGAGDDCLPGAEPFDKTIIKGYDAQTLINLKPNYYNLIWSSHCLEHLDDPFGAIFRWIEVLAPRGFLWLHVPDFDLYEHGLWPSRMNPDHKWAFSVDGVPAHKNHILLRALALNLVQDYNMKLLRLQLVHTNYNLSAIRVPADQTLGPVEASCEMVLRKLR